MAKSKQNELVTPEVRELVAIKRLLILQLQKAGVLQGEVAKALGVDQATVSRMMSAK